MVNIPPTGSITGPPNTKNKHPKTTTEIQQTQGGHGFFGPKKHNKTVLKQKLWVNNWSSLAFFEPRCEPLVDLEGAELLTVLVAAKSIKTTMLRNC